MSYPASINSIAARSDGPDQIIYAAHLNAIRTALLDIVSHFGNDLKRSAADLATRLNVHLDANGYPVPPSNTIYVGKSGFKYSTVQSAIDAISDAAADKPYIVFIFPGIYNEKITCGNYISLVGVGPMPVEIYYDLANNETLVTLATHASIQNLYLRADCSTGGAVAYGIRNDGKATTFINNVILNFGTMTGDLIALYILNDGTVHINNSELRSWDQPCVKNDGLGLYASNCNFQGGTYGVYCSGDEESCEVNMRFCLSRGTTGAIDAANAQVSKIGMCCVSHAVGANMGNEIGTPNNCVDTSWNWSPIVW